MFGALDRLGFDLEALLASAGLSLADLDDPDKYIAPGTRTAILRQAERERRVRNLGLRIAMDMQPCRRNPLLDYLIISSDSLGDGLQRLGRYLGLVNPAIHVTVREQDDPVRVLVEAPGEPLLVEMTVAMCVVRCGSEVDGDLRVSHVSFSHEPEDAAEFAAVLRCPVKTRASWSGWSTTRACLRLPMRRRDPVLCRWLERDAVQILARQPAGGSVTHDVRRLLSSGVAGGDTRIEVIARQLAMTSRTLQRRLADEHTSYDALRDDMRKQAAETYLADPALSITEVAYLLGYAEPTAFHRAFKRWHGITAQAFRERLAASTAR
jgi:AraC-like DNA-binding protein